jgi:MerR family transcriptional regulator, mercuric resistance operon regulatory protein
MDDIRPQLPIGELSKRTGCNIETIRYYERIGVLRRPARTEGGFRRYSLDDLRRLAFVRRARDLGFTLDEVRTLLRLADRRERSCAAVRDLAVAHLNDVRAKIVDLKKMQRVLHGMVLQCADGTLPECPLIEALFDVEASEFGRGAPPFRR